MATRQIKHRLGKIEYEYNNQIPWTDTDQQMADGIAHCLLANEKSSEEVDALFKRAGELSKHAKQLTENHENVGEVLKKAQVLAGGYVGAIELGQYAIANELSDATNTANNAIQQQNKDVTAIHSDYSKLIEDYNQKEDQNELDSQEVYGKLNSLFSLGYEEKNLATDLVSFDRASETVRAVLSVSYQSQETKLERVLSVTRDFELLLAKVDGQQKVWEEFCSRLILIEYIGKLRSGNQPTSFN